MIIQNTVKCELQLPEKFWLKWPRAIRRHHKPGWIKHQGSEMDWNSTRNPKARLTYAKERAVPLEPVNHKPPARLRCYVNFKMAHPDAIYHRLLIYALTGSNTLMRSVFCATSHVKCLCQSVSVWACGYWSYVTNKAQTSTSALWVVAVSSMHDYIKEYKLCHPMFSSCTNGKNIMTYF